MKLVNVKTVPFAALENALISFKSTVNEDFKKEAQFCFPILFSNSQKLKV